ncbi:hypothetical protein B7494_g2914 [Chlorociboria aeruginascens]|nr:hypothetical protein B7494_g2914 [Chlorociboria aeruginascens]
METTRSIQEIEDAFSTELNNIKRLNDQKLQQEVERMETEYAANLQKEVARIENESFRRDRDEAMDERALAFLSRDTVIGDAYTDVCEQRIRAYQAEIKSMFQTQIDEIALENKNWLKGMVGAGRLDEEQSLELEGQAKEKIMGSWEYDVDIPVIERDAVRSLKESNWTGKTATEIIREARQRDLERKRERENGPLSRRARAPEHARQVKLEHSDVEDRLPYRPRKRRAIELQDPVASASNRIVDFKPPHIPLPKIPLPSFIPLHTPLTPITQAPPIYPPPVPYVTPAFDPISSFNNAPAACSYSSPSFTPINKRRVIYGAAEMGYSGRK